MPNVTLTIPSETANRLRQKASRDGLSLETYLARLAEREAQSANGAVPATTDGPIALPLWEGTVHGSLSRRELYDDVD